MPKLYVYNGKITNYLVYEDGRVFNTVKQRFISGHKNPGGYWYITIYLGNGKSVERGIHQMVAECFIPNPENKKTVNHKDGNKSKNNVENLEWATMSEQIYHMYETGLRSPNPPSKVVFTKYSEDQVIRACEMISEGEFLSNIEEETGIPVKTLGEIRSRKIWKSISDKYTFPDRIYVSSKLYKPEFRREVEKYIRDGYRPHEISTILNISKEDKKTRKLIQEWHYRLKKAQRPVNDDVEV